MFKFKRRQEVFEISGIKAGGQPGRYPTVLIGSVFYEGHDVVEDSRIGIFDRKRAEELISRQAEMSDRTKNPHMVDVVGLTSEAIIKYIDFVSTVTDAPFLIDSALADVRMKAAKYVAEVGLQDRAIYDSIGYWVTKEELSAIKQSRISAAILLALSPEGVLPEGRLDLLKEKLLEDARGAGIEKPLVDVAVLDVPSIGYVARAVYLVKRELGLPTGAAPSNAILGWKKVHELSSYGKSTCLSGSAVLLMALGADFILYGPIKYSDVVFPACAMADAIIAYNARGYGIRTETRDHPLYTIF